MTANSYNSLQMAQGQCTSTVVFTTSTELGINYTGSYPITVTVDANNAVDESNESNNTLSQSLFLETLQTQLPDLIVDRIFTNDSARTLTARVCNIGTTMSSNTNWTMDFINTNNNALMRNTGGNLAQGQCIDISNSYLSLSIYQSGGYNFRATVDTASAITEQSKSNNSLSQYLSLHFSY
jgi:subtilase family serine protease